MATSAMRIATTQIQPLILVPQKYVMASTITATTRPMKGSPSPSMRIAMGMVLATIPLPPKHAQPPRVSLPMVLTVMTPMLPPTLLQMRFATTWTTTAMRRSMKVLDSCFMWMPIKMDLEMTSSRQKTVNWTLGCPQSVEIVTITMRGSTPLHQRNAMASMKTAMGKRTRGSLF